MNYVISDRVIRCACANSAALIRTLSLISLIMPMHYRVCSPPELQNLYVEKVAYIPFAIQVRPTHSHQALLGHPVLTIVVGTRSRWLRLRPTQLGSLCHGDLSVSTRTRKQAQCISSSAAERMAECCLCVPRVGSCSAILSHRSRRPCSQVACYHRYATICDDS